MRYGVCPGPFIPATTKGGQMWSGNETIAEVELEIAYTELQAHVVRYLIFCYIFAQFNICMITIYHDCTISYSQLWAVWQAS